MKYIITTFLLVEVIVDADTYFECFKFLRKNYFIGKNDYFCPTDKDIHEIVINNWEADKEIQEIIWYFL